MEDNDWWKAPNPIPHVTVTFHVCDVCIECHWIQLDGSRGGCEKCGGDTKYEMISEFDDYVAYRTNLHQWKIGRLEEEIEEAVEQQRMAIQMEVL